jgi:deoxyribonuclease-1
MKARRRPVARAALLTAVLSIGPGWADAPEAYVQTLRRFWGEVYGGGGTELYCGDRFDRETGRGLNVEHIFPMSWVGNELRCGSRDQCRDRSAAFLRIETDMHNMYPARPELNSARGNLPFAEIDGEERRFGACDFEKDDRGRRVEPRPAARGEIARAMFYMQQAYGLPIYPRQGETLLRWHRADPPDEAERRRNDAVARLQGRRNPFIDTPALADELRFEAPRR